MPKVLELNIKNKKGEVKNTGKIEIKNQTKDNAELYFYGDIVSDTWSSYWCDEDKCPQEISDFLKELDKSKDLDIYINSGGGSVFAGIAIYSMLKRHSGKKIVHIDGLAASIASVIALVGDEIRAPKYSNFMIHNPLCMMWDTYNSKDLRKVADALDSCKESILNIYMEHVKEGVTREKVSNFMDEEKWFTGETVSEIFNVVVEEELEAVACISSYFDKYKNMPKELLINKEPQSDSNLVDEDIIVKRVIATLNQKNTEEEMQNIENLKKEILEDLDCI